MGLLSTSIMAQTPGAVISGGTTTVLDPDQDGFITSSGTTLSTTDELSQFENYWRTVYQLDSEPSGDFTGGSCGALDIVDATSTSKESLYTGVYDPDGYPSNNDGDEYWLFRLRVAKDPGTSPFAYSVIIDIDNAIGSGIDANYVAGNNGYEIEVIFQGGSAPSLKINDVDGTTTGTQVLSYSGSTLHWMKSYAANSICSSTPIFMDFAIPVADLTTQFGIDLTTGVRIAAGTTTNGTSILSGANTKDYAGFDDNNTTDDPTLVLITNQTNESLPVELSSFDLVETENNVELIWVTQTEINNSHFVITFSRNGTDFYPISEHINGNGTTLYPSYYSYIIAKQKIDNTGGYFKLKQVDYNGDTYYSNILPYFPSKMGEANFKVNLLGQVVDPKNNQLGFSINVINGKATKTIIIKEP